MTFRSPSPPEPAPGADARPGPAHGAAATAGVVLLVDDNPAALLTIGAWLRGAGYEVREAASGGEALHRAFDADDAVVDLIVLDVHLPDVHGFEVARRLKRDARTAHVPVLHLSAAQLTATDRVQGLEAGADAYLMHPLEPAELLATTSALLRGHRLRQALGARLAAEQSAAERLSLLQAVTADLVATSTRDGVGRAVLARTMPAFGAERGDLALCTPDGAAFEVLGATAGGEPVPEAWRRVASTLATPVAAASAADDAVSAWPMEVVRARFPAVAPALDALGVAAVWCVRIAVGARVLGTLDLAFRTPRTPTPEDHVVLSSVAAQCAVALERVEFADAERAARARAERLQRVTEALSEATSVGDVVDATVREAAAAFGAVGTVVALVRPDGATLELAGVSAMPGELSDAWRRFPLAAEAPLADAARTGEPVLLPSRAAWAARYPALVGVADAAGHQANAVLPLRIHRRLVGAVGLAFDAPHAFGADEVALLTTTAHQVGQALERAQLYDAERQARAEAEAARAAAEEARAAAEAANRAKSDFLATMSHELRTPLNAIAGHAQLMEMGIHGPVTEQQRDALVRVERAQRHLLRLVNDVLNFARIEGGRLEYAVGPVRLAEVVAELEPLIGPQLQAGALGYTTDVPGDCVVRADREKLVQVLLNLVSNSIKFTPAGGHVTVGCASRDDGTTPAGAVHVRVSDTGVGIPPDKLAAVFEPFVQVDSSYAGRAAGAGLGLAISRELARGMGGDLRVRSTVGAGTAFTVTLPAAG